MPLAVLLGTPSERLEEAQIVIPLEKGEEGEEVFGRGQPWEYSIRKRPFLQKKRDGGGGGQISPSHGELTLEPVTKLVGMQAAFMLVDPSVCPGVCECSLGVPFCV